MKKNRRMFRLGLNLAVCMAGLTFAGTSSSNAEDATCKLVLDAMSRGVMTPNHSYFTMKLAALGGKSTSGEKIGTGTALYEKDGGKWEKSALTPQDVKDQMEENRKTSKVSCQFLRDETVDGVSASLYAMHEQDDGGAYDAKVWIAKSNGLPAHEIMDGEGVSSDTRFVYGAVTSPNTD